MGALYLAGCMTTPSASIPVPAKPETVEASLPSKPTTPAIIRQAVIDKAEVLPTTEEPKYKPLVYGQKKRLVCDLPFPAKGKLEGRPNMQVMWENYLYDRPEGIWGEVGGLVEVNGNLPIGQGRWTNGCAVRISHMLNKAGYQIPRERAKTVSGGDGDQYYYRVIDLEAYLTKTFGPPDLAINDGSGKIDSLPLEPGILLMDFPGSTFSGHVTIWNGASTVDGADIGGHRVLLWKLPCYLPPERSPS